MSRSFIFFCLILLIIVMDSDQSPPRRSSSSKKPTKGIDYKRSMKPKPNPPPIPGQLSYGGKRLDLNLTEGEALVYSANNSMFPDGLYYPWFPNTNTSNDVDYFMDGCLNTTIEKNKAWVLKLQSEEEVYMNVALHAIKFLCLDNYGKQPNRANQCTGGLWVNVLVVLISFAMQSNS